MRQFYDLRNSEKKKVKIFALLLALTYEHRIRIRVVVALIEFSSIDKNLKTSIFCSQTKRRRCHEMFVDFSIENKYNLLDLQAYLDEQIDLSEIVIDVIIFLDHLLRETLSKKNTSFRRSFSIE